ncbi:hypothetical protein, partial [Mesorhizobium sp. M1E.F.Ca.ET.063.01.1.1]|uniref:hypothetical protein n=1 Tax=Mesorhizobium sp. M1E.F.Ca.ET.063.01.1.1 TaxID=2496750 RepID=UPI001AED0E81
GEVRVGDAHEGQRAGEFGDKADLDGFLIHLILRFWVFFGSASKVFPGRRCRTAGGARRGGQAS